MKLFIIFSPFFFESAKALFTLHKGLSTQTSLPRGSYHSLLHLCAWVLRTLVALTLNFHELDGVDFTVLESHPTKQTLETSCQSLDNFQKVCGKSTREWETKIRWIECEWRVEIGENGNGKVWDQRNKQTTKSTSSNTIISPSKLLKAKSNNHSNLGCNNGNKTNPLQDLKMKVCKMNNGHN